MILAYRVLERRIKALKRAILHVFFVLNLNMHKHGDFMNAYKVIERGVIERGSEKSQSCSMGGAIWKLENLLGKNLKGNKFWEELKRRALIGSGDVEGVEAMKRNMTSLVCFGESDEEEFSDDKV